MKETKDYYIDKDGTRYPRVTAVLQTWYDPEQARAVWVAQEAQSLAQSLVDGKEVQLVESMWTGSKFEWVTCNKDPLKLLQDTQYMRGAADRRAQGAMDRGTLTNLYLDEYADGLRITPDDVPEWVSLKFEEGKMMDDATRPTPWKADPEEVCLYVSTALKWATDRKPELRQKQVFLKSDEPKFAGTCDFIGIMDDNLTVFEIKTGKPSRSHALQVVTYADMVQWLAGVPVVPRLVYFTKDSDGTMRYMEKTITTEREECSEAFLRSLDNFNFSKQKTPWNNNKSVRMEWSDFAFGVR